MPSLSKLQTTLAIAIRAAAARETFEPSAELWDVLDRPSRLAVHVNHFRASLTDALRGAYPAVAKLVGDGFFSYATAQFVARHPPQLPFVAEYGEAFPAFLEALPQHERLAYLGDLARLEWAMHRASIAPRPDAPDIADLPPNGWAEWRLQFEPHVGLIASDWPVVSLWRFARSEPGDSFDLARRDAERALVFRDESDVRCRILSPAAFAFFAAFGTARSLGAANAAAIGFDADFDALSELRWATTMRLFAPIHPVAERT